MSTGAVLPVSSGRHEPYMRMAELLMGSRIALALHVAAKRGIADLLGDGAKSAEELSPQAGIPARSLRRLLRALSYVGVFRENIDGRFTNTDVSAYLRADADPSLREMSLILTDVPVLHGRHNLDQLLETAHPPFPPLHRQTFSPHIP